MTVFNVNLNDIGVSVFVTVLIRAMLTLLKAVVTIAVDVPIAVAAIFVAPANETAAVRSEPSALTELAGVVAPEAIVNEQWVCFDNTAVPDVNSRVAVEPVPLATTVNAVDPHPLSTTVDIVPHTKSGNTNVIVSSTLRSAVSANANDIEVAVDVSGVPIVSVLELIVG